MVYRYSLSFLKQLQVQQFKLSLLRTCGSIAYYTLTCYQIISLFPSCDTFIGSSLAFPGELCDQVFVYCLSVAQTANISFQVLVLYSRCLWVNFFFLSFNLVELISDFSLQCWGVDLRACTFQVNAFH